MLPLDDDDAERLDDTVDDALPLPDTETLELADVVTDDEAEWLAEWVATDVTELLADALDDPLDDEDEEALLDAEEYALVLLEAELVAEVVDVGDADALSLDVPLLDADCELDGEAVELTDTDDVALQLPLDDEDDDMVLENVDDALPLLETDELELTDGVTDDEAERLPDCVATDEPELLADSLDDALDDDDAVVVLDNEDDTDDDAVLLDVALLDND